MAADSHGNLWVSLTTWGLYDDSVDPPLTTSNIGQIWKVTPTGHADAQGDHGPDALRHALGVAVRDDRVYVAVYDQGAGTISTGVYRLDAGGKLTQVVALPEGAWPNGIAFHDRYLYMTDSGLGAVWRARVGAGMASPAKPWLHGRPPGPGRSEHRSLHGRASARTASPSAATVCSSAWPTTAASCASRARRRLTGYAGRGLRAHRS